MHNGRKCSIALVAVAGFSTVQIAVSSVRVRKQIGSIEDQAYTFSRIEGLAQSASGDIFVLQHEEAAVNQYDAQGTFRRRLGRRGSGPGEFVLPTKLWSMGRELWVLDQGNSRLTRFDVDGAVRSAVPLATLGLRAAVQNIEVSADGSIIATKRVDTSALMAGRTFTPLLRIRPGTTDTLGIINLANSITAIRSPDGKGVTVRRNPFADNDLYAVLRQHQTVVVLTRRGERPLLHWINSDGDTARSLQVPLASQPIPAAMRDSVITDYARAAMRSGKVGTLAAGRQLVLKNWRVPEQFAAATDLISDETGRVWVRGAPRGKNVEWLVYDTAGNVVDRIRVPADVKVRSVRSNFLLAVKTGEFDESYVLELEVIRGR